MATRVDIDMALAQKVALDAAERGVRAATLEARNIAVVLLSQPGTGRTYQRGKTVEHTASSPGDPPAPDTGRLRASLQTEVLRGPREVVGILSANTEYAAALELGTERIRPRPYLSRIPREFGSRLRMVFQKLARV
jgi:phage gpG-like protein